PAALAYLHAGGDHPGQTLCPAERRLARELGARARRCAAAAVPDLSRAGRRRGFVSRLLVQALVHRAALLRAARHPIPLRSRPRPLVAGVDRPSPVLSPPPPPRAAR